MASGSIDKVYLTCTQFSSVLSVAQTICGSIERGERPKPTNLLFENVPVRVVPGGHDGEVWGRYCVGSGSTPYIGLQGFHTRRGADYLRADTDRIINVASTIAHEAVHALQHAEFPIDFFFGNAADMARRYRKSGHIIDYVCYMLHPIERPAFAVGIAAEVLIKSQLNSRPLSRHRFDEAARRTSFLKALAEKIATCRLQIPDPREPTMTEVDCNAIMIEAAWQAYRHMT